MAALIQFASGAPGIKYSLNARLLTIGRGTSGNDICLPCSFVSKHHATIEVVERGCGVPPPVHFIPMFTHRGMVTTPANVEQAVSSTDSDRRPRPRKVTILEIDPPGTEARMNQQPPASGGTG